MGATPKPEDLLDIVRQLVKDVRELKSANPLNSAKITRGGLSITNDAYFKTVTSGGVYTVYVGPVDGRQEIQIRRADGTLVLATQLDVASGNDFWALWDRGGQILVADDVQSGHGLARPYLAVPMHQLFTTNVALGSVVNYNTIDAAAIATEKALREGRIPLGSHPRIMVDGVWGQASGSNNTTFKLKVAGSTVGTWTESGTLEVARKGPYDITSVIGNEGISVQVTAVATGTGAVAAQVFGCWLRQT